MEEKREVGVSPARMACLMEVARKVAKQMTTSTWRREIDETRRKNEELQAETQSRKE